MDRWIGMISSAHPGVAYGRGFLYYQSDSKQPIPGNVALYNIMGATIGTTAPLDFKEQKWNVSNANVAASGGTSMSNMVCNPLVHYGDKTWNTATLWGDGTLTRAEHWNAKSIFDPCPPGWHMSIYNAFREDIRAATWSYDTYNCYYRPVGYSDQVVSFQRNGYRTMETGTFNDGLSVGHNKLIDWAYGRFASTDLFNKEGNSTSLGGVIRCISMPQ